MLYLTGVLLSGLGDKAAYLDPGSGSFLLQLLIAGLLGAGLALRASWGKIKKWFGRGDEANDEEAEGDEEDA